MQRHPSITFFAAPIERTLSVAGPECQFGLLRPPCAAMSALPPKADIHQCNRHVRFVPKAEVGNLANPRSITISSFDVSN
jgi:hypothetical protein